METIIEFVMNMNIFVLFFSFVGCVLLLTYGLACMEVVFMKLFSKNDKPFMEASLERFDKLSS